MNEASSNKQKPKNSFAFSSGKLLALSLASSGLYFLVAISLFHFFHEGGLFAAFESGFSAGVQMGIGVVSGAILATVIFFIMSRPPVSEVLPDFYIIRVLSNTRFSLFDHTQLSLFAGMGEELLFRGALQPLLGNVFTSLIFVGIHGYFKFKSPGHIVFGSMMFGLSIVLGLLFAHAGLIAAMTAHAVYDLIMLQIVQKNNLHSLSI